MQIEEMTFETKYGKFCVSSRTDLRSFNRLQKGYYGQSDDIELLKNFITESTIVVDIGAHIGTMTIPFAQKAKRVYSFEPVPTTRNYLEKNIVLNNLKNIVVLPYAAGSKTAEGYIHVTSEVDAGQNTVSEYGEIPIQIRRVDEQIDEANLIKIDAEGLEHEVLEGSMTLITKVHPVIFCEINFGQLWQHKSSPKQLEMDLRKAGYTLYLPMGVNRLGRIYNLSLTTGLLHPAFFLGKPRNFAFDVIAALPEDIPSTTRIESVFETILWIFINRFILRFRKKIHR